MSLRLPLAVTSLALASLLSNAATAGVGDNAGGVIDLLKRTSPVLEAQSNVDDDDDYCWYASGWRGPGWYLCDDEWDNGVGWGGPYGWNGWGGGHPGRRRHFQGVGIRRPGSPNERQSGGGGLVGARHDGHRSGGALLGHHAPGAVRAPPPSLHFGGGAPIVHSFGGPASTVHSFGGGAPIVHSFGGAVPTVHSFGGGAPSTAHGVGVEGFHGVNPGGAASFPSAGIGGHR